MNHLENIFSLDNVPLEDRLEGHHWREVMNGLTCELGESFNNYRFFFHSMPTHSRPDDIAEKGGPDAVLILLGDNSGSHFADELWNFRCVFKVHLAGPFRHVHPVPLGTTKMQLYGCVNPASGRSSNVFFSGNINAHRVDLWRALMSRYSFPLQNIKSRLIRRLIVHIIRRLGLRRSFHELFPDSYIEFTSGFLAGMGPEDYSRHLAEAKIAISPFGFGRAECFRHFEAMRAGCVVITDRLPNTWYFKDSPIIQIKQWSDLRQLINTLLADIGYLQSHQESTIKWWNDVCSPRGVARYMASAIRDSVNPESRARDPLEKAPKHHCYH